MNEHIDPAEHAARHTDAIYDYSERMEAEEWRLFCELKKAKLAHELAMFAPRIKNWKTGGLRFQSIFELLDNAAQTQGMADVYQVLIDAAAGKDVRDMARSTLTELCATWARENAVIGDDDV